MIKRHTNRLSAIGGVFAVCAALAATPALASVTSCPSTSLAYFAGGTVDLAEEPASAVWSSPVTLTAYCGSVDPANVLSGVSVAGVFASSTAAKGGTAITDLKASADGGLPTTLLNVINSGLPFPPSTFLAVPANTATNDKGEVTFLLRVQSATHPYLAGPNGAPQLVGLQLAVGEFSTPDPIGGGFLLGGGSIFATTPELDSLVLFGSGAAGLAGYALMRLRARRRD